jgi:FkbM family methyltransferase
VITQRRDVTPLSDAKPLPTDAPKSGAIEPVRSEKPDAWLYNRATLGWLLEPTLSNQLPWLYQLFSIYCNVYFRLTRRSDLIGGRALFQLLANLHKRWSPQRYLHFYLLDYEVFLDPTDARFFQVVNELTQPYADPQILSSLLTSGDTFIDVGANHGSFAIVASKLVGTQGLVVAIEPQPRLAQAVERSLTANASGAFQVHPVAVGNLEGEIELLLPQGTSGSAGIYPAHSGTHYYQVIKVPIKRFADLVSWQHFPGKVVIKVDIEGSEIVFLDGAKSVLLALKPILIIEIHPGTLKAAQTTGNALKQLLQAFGYIHYAEMQSLETRCAIADLDTSKQRNVVMFMT